MKSKLIYLNLLFPLFWSIFISFILTKHKVAWGLYYGFVDIFIVTPGVLFIFNVYLLKNKIAKSITKCAVFMAVGLMLPLLEGYLTWGIKTGRLFTPDLETVNLNMVTFYYYIIIVSAVFGAMGLWRWYKKRAAN